MSPAQVVTVNGCANSALRASGYDGVATHCASGSGTSDVAQALFDTMRADGPPAAAAKSAVVNAALLSGSGAGPDEQRITASLKPFKPLPLRRSMTSVCGGHGRTSSVAEYITPLNRWPTSRT